MYFAADKWRRAVPERISRRKYVDKEIKSSLLQVLKDVCTRFVPYEGVRSVIVEDSSGDIFSGIVGSYGKITGAPAYVAFIGDTSVKDIEAKVGYTGEGIILEATALGIDTCWVAGFFHPAKVAEKVELAPTERVFAVSPLGFACAKIGMSEQMTRRFARADRRKSAAELCAEWASEAWPEWVRAGVELARVAPSAVNRQPWRFRIQDGTVVIAVDGPETFHISKRLDCGIAMLHFELGALCCGVKGIWTFLEAPDVAIYHLQLEQTSSS